MNETIDHTGARLVGPMGLVEALDASNSEMAVSSPYGAYVAVRREGVIGIRRLAELSGRGGSVMGTGAWLTPEEMAPALLWRPA